LSAIQAEQHFFRRRAERLFADIRELELQKTSRKDALETLGHWGRAVHYGSGCPDSDCLLDIHLTDSLLAPISDLVGTHPRLLSLYLSLGGRGGMAKASVDLKDGTVRRKSFSVSVEVPHHNGAFASYGLMGQASSVSNFRPGTPDLLLHPYFTIGGPDGCEGPCIAAWFKFTPYADPADVRRFMQFDFSCLTRWTHPCATERDIMPAAWAEHLSEQPKIEAARDEYRNCGLQTLQILGRDSTDIALVEIRSKRESRENENGEYTIVKSRLLQRLKDAAFWEEGTDRDVVIDARNLAASNSPAEIITGARFIFLFWHWSAGPNKPEIVCLEPCGAAPFSKNNLTVVEAGMAQDDPAER
jgi:hypothetical protein